MAHHCELAGLVDRSVDYLRAAGVASTRIVAIPEALSYFQRADAAMSTLEPSAANSRRHIDIILGLMEVGRFAILPSRLRELSARARQLSGRDGVSCDASVTAAILFQDARAKLQEGGRRGARHLRDLRADLQQVKRHLTTSHTPRHGWTLPHRL